MSIHEEKQLVWGENCDHLFEYSEDTNSVTIRTISYKSTPTTISKEDLIEIIKFIDEKKISNTSNDRTIKAEEIGEKVDDKKLTEVKEGIFSIDDDITENKSNYDIF